MEIKIFQVLFGFWFSVHGMQNKKQNINITNLYDSGGFDSGVEDVLFGGKIVFTPDPIHLVEEVFGAV